MTKAGSLKSELIDQYINHMLLMWTISNFSTETQFHTDFHSFVPDDNAITQPPYAVV